MKAEVQERLLREITELGEEEARKKRHERLLRNPILGPFFQAKGMEPSKQVPIA